MEAVYRSKQSRNTKIIPRANKQCHSSRPHGGTGTTPLHCCVGGPLRRSRPRSSCHETRPQHTQPTNRDYVVQNLETSLISSAPMSRHVEIAHRNHSGTLDSTAETAPAPLPAGEVPEADGRSGKEAMARDILCLDFFGSSQLATPDLNENFDFRFFSNFFMTCWYQCKTTDLNLLKYLDQHFQEGMCYFTWQSWWTLETQYHLIDLSKIMSAKNISKKMYRTKNTYTEMLKLCKF